MPINPTVAGSVAGEGLMAGLGQFLEPLNYPRKAMWSAIGLPEEGSQAVTNWTGMDKESLLAKALGFGLETAADPLNLVGGFAGGLAGKGLAKLGGKVGSMVEDAARMSPGLRNFGGSVPEIAAAGVGDLPMIENLRLPASTGRMSPITESISANPTLKSVMERSLLAEPAPLNPSSKEVIQDYLMPQPLSAAEPIPDDWFKTTWKPGDRLNDFVPNSNSGGYVFDVLRRQGVKPHEASLVDPILDASQELPYGGRYPIAKGQFRGIQRPIEHELIARLSKGIEPTSLEKQYIEAQMMDRTDRAFRRLAERWSDSPQGLRHFDDGLPNPGAVLEDPDLFPEFTNTPLAKAMLGRKDMLYELLTGNRAAVAQGKLPANWRDLLQQQREREGAELMQRIQQGRARIATPFGHIEEVDLNDAM